MSIPYAIQSLIKDTAPSTSVDRLVVRIEGWGVSVTGSSGLIGNPTKLNGWGVPRGQSCQLSQKAGRIQHAGVP